MTNRGIFLIFLLLSKSTGLNRTPAGYQVDHIVPLSKGGADKVWNMQLIPKDSPKEKNELK